MNLDSNSSNGTVSVPAIEPDSFPAATVKPEGVKTRRYRSKGDPTRLNGALVISDDTKRALERCELFQKLDRQQMMAVAALVEEHSVKPGETLIAEGESAKHLYIFVEGRGVAQVELEHGWLSLGLVHPGDAAGWSSLIEGQIYPASVSALTDVRVARIEGSGLRLLMNVEPGIGNPIHSGLSEIFYRQYEAALKAFKTAG